MEKLELVGVKTSNSLELYVSLDTAVVTEDYYNYEDYNLVVLSDEGVIESFLVDDIIYEVCEGQLVELIFSPCETVTERHITLSTIIDCSLFNN